MIGNEKKLLSKMKKNRLEMKNIGDDLNIYFDLISEVHDRKSKKILRQIVRLDV